MATLQNAHKRKRKPAGTPDPNAEVISLSPQTLLESDRYVCEICNQGFQRDQNLQMHRRRHKVPWKLLKRERGSNDEVEVRKKVFVCPEKSCLHNDPRHALGDLVGIKKHYRRKHSDRKQWVCVKCEKGYAVQSDYKAHVKTCGTRGHTCDCGKVFSRVESFIEHQDTCNANKSRSSLQNFPQPPQILTLSPSSSSPSQSTTETNLNSTRKTTTWSSFLQPNLELQLLPLSPSTPNAAATTTTSEHNNTSNDTNNAHLNLSLGLSLCIDNQSSSTLHLKRELDVAEEEFVNAKKIRQQAQTELHKALMFREHAEKSINSVLLQITCQSCKLRLWPTVD